MNLHLSLSNTKVLISLYIILISVVAYYEWAFWPSPLCLDLQSGQSIDWLTASAMFGTIILAVAVPFMIIPQLAGEDSTLSEFILTITFAICNTIVLFAFVYAMIGIQGPDGNVARSFFDYIYFSTITMTTVGYGDFRPCPSARLVASVHALVGVFLVPVGSAVIVLKRLQK